MRRWSRVWVVVLAGVLAGCSGDDGGPATGSGTTAAPAVAPAEVFDRAADATAAAPASRFRTESSVVGTTRLAEGVVDPARAAFALTISSQADPRSYGSAEAPSDLVVVDRTWYVRGGRASSIAAATGLTPAEWLRVDLAALPGRNPFIATPDHTSLLALLRAVDTVPEQVGQEPRRGTPTTHWRAVITPKVLEAGLGTGSSGLPIDGTVADLTMVVLDVWVDAQGVVREATYRVDLAAAGPAGQAIPNLQRGLYEQSRRTWELWDVGAAPQVAAPAGAVDVTAALTAPPRAAG